MCIIVNMDSAQTKISSIIISPGESWGYTGFMSVALPP